MHVITHISGLVLLFLYSSPLSASQPQMLHMPLTGNQTASFASSCTWDLKITWKWFPCNSHQPVLHRLYICIYKSTKNEVKKKKKKTISGFRLLYNIKECWRSRFNLSSIYMIGRKFIIIGSCSKWSNNWKTFWMNNGHVMSKLDKKDRPKCRSNNNNSNKKIRIWPLCRLDKKVQQK